MKIRIAFLTSGEIVECHDWPQTAFKKLVKKKCADSHCKAVFCLTPSIFDTLLGLTTTKEP